MAGVGLRKNQLLAAGVPRGTENGASNGVPLQYRESTVGQCPWQCPSGRETLLTTSTRMREYWYQYWYILVPVVATGTGHGSMRLPVLVCTRVRETFSERRQALCRHRKTIVCCSRIADLIFIASGYSQPGGQAKEPSAWLSTHTILPSTFIDSDSVTAAQSRGVFS